MIKKLIKKYQAYRDRRFLARLERVLNSNIVKSNLLISGGVFIHEDVWIRLPTIAQEDILQEIPLDVVQDRIRQGYYER